MDEKIRQQQMPAAQRLNKTRANSWRENKAPQ